MNRASEKLAAIVGKANAVFSTDDESFDAYLRDETYLQGAADLVLRPANAAEVCAVVEELNNLRAQFPAAQKNFSLTVRGGGSGLSGACVPASGIVLDLTRMDRIVDIDNRNQVIRAECGVILAALNGALEGSGLHYPVDPSSLALCTVGGSIATNAAGPSSLKYGTTRNYLAAAQIVTAAGLKTEIGSLPVKTSMGFSLTDLFCGSEGRLGIVTEASLRLKPAPEEIALLMTSFTSETSAMEFIMSLRAAALFPRSIEIIDAYSASLVDFTLDKAVVLLIEFDGTAEAVTHDMQRLQTRFGSLEWLATRDEKHRRELWDKRSKITHELKRRFAFKLGEDIAVPLTELARICAFARSQAAAHGVEVAIWGHAGDGNLHVNYLLETREKIHKLDTLMRELASEVTRAGGAMSGEHGLGRLKRKYAREVLPAGHFDMQRKIKTAFDPQMLFNPALEIDEP